MGRRGFRNTGALWASLLLAVLGLSLGWLGLSAVSPRAAHVQPRANAISTGTTAAAAGATDSAAATQADAPQVTGVVAAPAPAVIAAPLKPRAVVPAGPSRNRVAVPSVGIDVGVANVTDCEGTYPVPLTSAERNWCSPNDGMVYVIGHTPGIFVGLPAISTGQLVRYWNPAGQLQTYSVRSIERLSRDDVARAYADYDSPHIVLQTCATRNGAWVWIVKAYPV